MSTAPRINGVTLDDFSEEDILTHVIDNDLLHMIDLRGVFQSMDIFDRQYQFNRLKAEARRLGVDVNA